jgi:hypothetical protein
MVLGVGLDSTVALSYYPRHHGRKWGGRLAQMSDDTLELFHECTARHIVITSVHVPGVDMLADASSRRLVSLSDFALRKDTFVAMMRHFEASEVSLDLFADAATKKLPRYVSAKVDSRAAWTNAFARSWKDLVCFANPPLKLVPQVVSKFEADEGRRMVLVAPLFWNNTMQKILRLCTRPPLLLPKHSAACEPPLGWAQTEDHQLLPSARVSKDHWNLIAYDLSRPPSGAAASERQPFPWFSNGGRMQELTWTGAGGYSLVTSQRASRIEAAFRACLTW